jgi:hypothetical protein
LLAIVRNLNRLAARLLADFWISPEERSIATRLATRIFKRRSLVSSSMPIGSFSRAQPDCPSRGNRAKPAEPFVLQARRRAQNRSSLLTREIRRLQQSGCAGPEDRHTPACR